MNWEIKVDIEFKGIIKKDVSSRCALWLHRFFQDWADWLCIWKLTNLGFDVSGENKCTYKVQLQADWHKQTSFHMLLKAYQKYQNDTLLFLYFFIELTLSIFFSISKFIYLFLILEIYKIKTLKFYLKKIKPVLPQNCYRRVENINLQYYI